MTTLRIFIEADFLSAIDNSAREVTWVLFDADDFALRQGRGALTELPVAQQIELIVPAQWVSFVRATLPAGNRKRVLEALPYLIEDSLLTSPEQVHVVIADSLSNHDAMLATIEQSLLSNIITTFKASGIVADRVLPATLVPKLGLDSWAMVLCDNESFVRTGVASGLPLEFDSSDKPPMALQLVLQQAKAELTNTELSLSSDHVFPTEIVVYGNQNPQDLTKWSAILGVRFIANNSDWRLANPMTGMNFLQGRFQAASQGWAWLSQAKPAFYLLVATLLLTLVGSTIDWIRQSNEKKRLDHEMKALFTSTFPDASNVVDAPLQMQRKLSDLQHASGSVDQSDFLPLLADVTASTGGLASVVIMDYGSGQLVLSLEAKNEAAALALKQKLSTQGRIVLLENMKKSVNGVDYQLRFKAGGE